MRRAPLYRQFRRASVFGSIVTAGFVVVFALILIDWIRGTAPRIGADFTVFWTAMRLFDGVGYGVFYKASTLSELFPDRIHGVAQNIYAGHSPLAYLLFWPLSWLGHSPALLLFSLVNLGAWAGAVRLA